MEKEWLKKKNDFEVFDVRKLKGNFLQAIIIKAKKIEKGSGITIIQNFEPIPLYNVMRDLGYDYFIEKTDGYDYLCHFYRSEEVENDGKELPLKPIVMPRYADIDPKIANLTVNFWDTIWNKENPSIDLKYKFLLSLANAVGAGRIRQATRELIKAYYLGITVEQMEELFSLFIWNQGIGNFSSELAQSSLFKVFLMIKELEKKGHSHSDIMTMLNDTFSEKNKEMGFNN